MAATGLKLNKLKIKFVGNQRGISLTELLVGVALLAGIIFSTTQLYISTMEELQLIRSERFIAPLHLNMDSLFNQQTGCLNTFNATAGALANGQNIPTIRDGANGVVLTFPLNDLNNGTVDVIGAQVSDLIVAAPNVTFNIAVTYGYNKGQGVRQMTLHIPLEGTIDGLGRVTTCGSATAMVLSNSFIRINGAETKQGDITFEGNVEIGGEVLVDEAFPAATAPNLRVNHLGNASDVSLKTDIKKIAVSGQTFESIHGYRYKLKNYKGQHLGFIAQEILKDLPYAGVSNPTGISTLNYSAVIPVLWEYHKQVYIKRQELIKKINLLEGRLNAN
tara:strand:+ start:38916 stop:39914 length:999 start_codon:yes stop_codon:yes gene_type:complete